MKTSHIAIGLSLAFLASGCTIEPENIQLQNQNIQQANQIMQQQIQIDALKEQLAIQRAKQQISTYTEKKTYKKRKYTNKKVSPKTILAKATNTTVADVTPVVSTPKIPTPTKDIKKKLKKVEDKNYSSEYMYPVTDTVSKTKKKIEDIKEKPISNISSSEKMTKSACIAMIGQQKFDTYTKVFGGEAASIKRCNMIRLMQK